MNQMNQMIKETERTSLNRLKKRGAFDRETIYGILDQDVICQVGFVEEGSPVVIPMLYGRMGDSLILHGSTQSRVMNVLAAGAEICLTVTLLDGLVLARSAFHHSMNYRSVVAFGRAAAINDETQKSKALVALMEHLLPGRMAQVRAPSDQEMIATMVLSFPIDEASAKIRCGPPKDAKSDLSLGSWAGVVPLVTMALDPQPCPELDPSIPLDNDWFQEASRWPYRARREHSDE